MENIDLTVFFQIGYLIGSILLIIGLRRLSNPATAFQGNRLASIGIILGVLISLLIPLEHDYGNYGYILISLLIGGFIGLVAAKRVAMTAMPEMVSLFNGFGGICAVMITLVWFHNHFNDANFAQASILVSINLLLGSMAFTGSLLAFGKLNGTISDKTFRIPFNTILNVILLMVLIGFIIHIFLCFHALTLPVLLLFITLSLLYGLTFVLPIGGADMPVVISLLNSITGITAAMSGIITDDKLMLLGGILVGSSGTILTILMCKAMNRSLANVIIGSFSNNSTGSAFEDEEKDVKTISIMDLAVLLAYSERVAIIPGYGLAVSQAQKLCKELEQHLDSNDVQLKYAIHPVAGRMPGHMNVLLAEADIEYDKLMDLDESNAYLEDCDVAIVLGANDVVNPSALDDPSSNIYGMPILNLSRVKHTVVLKRSMNPGYAGIQNPLFFKDNTKMLFGDAKKSLQKIIDEIKNI